MPRPWGNPLSETVRDVLEIHYNKKDRKEQERQQKLAEALAEQQRQQALKDRQTYEQAIGRLADTRPNVAEGPMQGIDVTRNVNQGNPYQQMPLNEAMLRLTPETFMRRNYPEPQKPIEVSPGSVVGRYENGKFVADYTAPNRPTSDAANLPTYKVNVGGVDITGHSIEEIKQIAADMGFGMQDWKNAIMPHTQKGSLTADQSADLRQKAGEMSQFPFYTKEGYGTYEDTKFPNPMYGKSDSLLQSWNTPIGQNALPQMPGMPQENNSIETLTAKFKAQGYTDEEIQQALKDLGLLQ